MEFFPIQGRWVENGTNQRSSENGRLGPHRPGYGTDRRCFSDMGSRVQARDLELPISLGGAMRRQLQGRKSMTSALVRYSFRLHNSPYRITLKQKYGRHSLVRDQTD